MIDWKSDNSFSPIGLDVGTDGVKMVQLKAGENGVELHGIDTRSLPMSFDGSDDERNDRLVAAIRDILRTGSFTGRRIVTALPRAYMDIRQIKMPVMDRQQLAETLKWEASSYLPYDASEAVIDSKIIGKVMDEDKTKLEVILIAAHRQNVDKHLALLETAGLSCDTIDVVPFALARVMAHRSATPTSDAVAVIEVGFSVSTIEVLKDGKLHFSRALRFGGEHITGAISTELEMDRGKAEILKRQYGIDFTGTGTVDVEITDGKVADEDIPAIIYALSRPALEELVREIERSLTYFSTQTKGIAVEELILLGGGAALKHFDEYLREKTGIRTHVGDPFESLRRNGQFDHVIGDRGPAFAVAIGLALRGEGMQWKK